MNIHIYRQADSRWASLPYPGKGYNFGPNACGACAVLHCIIEMDKYKNWTPKDIQPYMKQFATYGSGTTWAGIQKALVHYGLKDVANIPTMPQLWRELEKGNRVGVLLFGSTKGPDGTVWTTGGHYIAFTGYRVKNGQHQLYLKDSGGRKHDGWYSYEKSMKGDVRQVWIGRLPNGHEVKESEQKATPVPTTNGKLTVDGIGGAATIKALQKYLKVSASDGVLSGQNKSLNKYYPSVKSVTYGSGGSATVKALQKWIGISADGVWGQGTSKALQKKLEVTADGIFGTNSMKALQKFLNNNMGGTTSSTTSKTTTTTTTTKTSTTSTTSTAKTTTPTNFRENVIDISYVQSKTIDWNKVKADGVHGAIIRCGYRGYGSGALNEDSMFMNHITGANKAGLKLGIYFFTEAINAAEGKAEAQFALKMLKKAGVKLTYPIAIDTENINAKNPVPRANSTKLSAAKRTEAIKAFCEEIKANGYEPMIYASTSWLNNQLQMSKLPYTVWVAQYNTKVTYGGKYAIWQYTSTAKVNGINQVVDKNYCYVNYSTPSSVATKAETTTTTTPQTTTTATTTTSSTTTKVALKSVDVIAQEVLDGKWGSGATRKAALINAGYDYDKVQAKVNELLKPKEVTPAPSEPTVKPDYTKEEEMANTIIAQFTKNSIVKIIELLQADINKPEPTPEPTSEPVVTPQPVVAQKYTGILPTITLKKTNAQVIADAIVWAKWIANDNSFHYGYGTHSHHNGCYFCGTNTLKGGRAKTGILDYEKTYCCNPFVGAAWAHGGGDSKAWELCHKGTSWDFHANAGYATSSLFKNLGHPAKSTLKAGDVLCKDTHVALYIGDGYLVEAAGSDDNKRNSTKWNNSISISKLTDSRYKGFLRVHRYIGNVNTTRPIYYGDVSYRVKDLQKYLNWYFGKEVCVADGVFGDGTLKYVKAFQTARKLTVDGIVGTNTIVEMGKVTK